MKRSEALMRFDFLLGEARGQAASGALGYEQLKKKITGEDFLNLAEALGMIPPCCSKQHVNKDLAYLSCGCVHIEDTKYEWEPEDECKRTTKYSKNI